MAFVFDRTLDKLIELTNSRYIVWINRNSAVSPYGYEAKLGEVDLFFEWLRDGKPTLVIRLADGIETAIADYKLRRLLEVLKEYYPPTPQPASRLELQEKLDTERDRVVSTLNLILANLTPS